MTVYKMPMVAWHQDGMAGRERKNKDSERLTRRKREGHDEERFGRRKQMVAMWE